MCNHYDIYQDTRIVGKAIVTQEGMFYHFCCHCNVPSSAVHCVILRSNGQQYDLGVCVPDGSAYRADKRIAKKEFTNTEFQFELTERGQMKPVRVQVNPDKQFDFLQYLEQAYFDTLDETPAICIPDTRCPDPDQPDNDQSP